MWMWLTPPSPPIPHRLLSPFSSASFFASSSSSSSLPESGCPDQSRKGRRSGGLWGRGSSGVAARGGGGLLPRAGGQVGVEGGRGTGVSRTGGADGGKGGVGVNGGRGGGMACSTCRQDQNSQKESPSCYLIDRSPSLLCLLVCTGEKKGISCSNPPSPPFTFFWRGSAAPAACLRFLVIPKSTIDIYNTGKDLKHGTCAH